MFQMKRKSLSVAALAAATSMTLGTPAFAQDTVELEEVIVTGSAIKRPDLDGALPIDVLNIDDIERIGITNAADLVEKIPSMQGFLTASDSVGGGGGGIRTASLRALGGSYTLSLLNGRRMAPADSGSLIDLSNIPVTALKRVEVLKDGASAIYGSDAVAGVVNFILKDSVDETTVTLRGDKPSEDGGESWGADIVTGFGDFESDGYSLVATFSHEEQDQLAAVDRDFAKTGFINFSHNGQELYFENSSINAIPGNAFVFDADGGFITGFNPYRLSNGGTCPAQTTPNGQFCRFDYTSTIEILPESDRDTLTLNGKLKLSENLTGFATVMLSQYESINRIAPYPTGGVPLPVNSALVQNEVFPHLTAEQRAQVGSVQGTWRALPGGNRTTEYTNDAANIVLGVTGESGNISYEGAINHAVTEINQAYPTGWLLLDEFVNIAGSGAINIFAGQEGFTEADQQALAPAIYSGDWDKTDVTMTSLDGKGTMPVFDMAGGEAQIAVGFDYRTTNYDRSISAANANGDLLFLTSDTPYELERDQFGVFTELYLPITDTFEVTGSLRYDDISATEDKLNGTGDIDSGEDDTTYKLTALWNVTDTFSLRGSLGTGFKAPSMREIGEPRSDFGVTSGTFACPFGAGDSRAALCLPGENQYGVFRQGNPNLTFETSEQYTFGFVFTPLDNLDMTVDYWNIKLDDIVDRATEAQIFGNPALYDDLFSTRINQATGRQELAIVQAAINVATAEQSGIDWAINYTDVDVQFGSMDFALAGTYMNKSDNSLYGSSLGRFGDDDNVVFRNIINFTTTLRHGDFTHTLFANYKSGYDDQMQTVEVLGTGVPLGQGPETDVQLDVDSYLVTDYQLHYDYSEKLGFDLGIKNLFDEEPNLSLRVSGSGHQVGWDPRYSDAYGRTFYGSVSFKF